MEWSAASAVGWGGTLQNMGALSFTGVVSLGAAADEAGFLDDNAGAWPVVVNGEGAEVVIEADAELALEWLLWNKGGHVLVSTRARSPRQGLRVWCMKPLEGGGCWSKEGAWYCHCEQKRTW